MAESSGRLLVIVGSEKYQYEDDEYLGEPFVIGAFNNEYMNQIDFEDGERIIRELKEKWTMDPDAYEWREILVDVSWGDLSDLFGRKVVKGVIVDES